MKLRAIVATATRPEEAHLIFTEIAKSHHYIEFVKIEGRQVTIVYEPEQDRLDRLNQEAQAEQAALAPVKKSAKKLTLEDLNFKLKHLELRNLYVTVSAWVAGKPQEFQIIDSSIFGNGLIFKSNSAIAVSRKLTKISKERQAADRALAVKAYESGACEEKIEPVIPENFRSIKVDGATAIKNYYKTRKLCPQCEKPLDKEGKCPLSKNTIPVFAWYGGDPDNRENDRLGIVVGDRQIVIDATKFAYTIIKKSSVWAGQSVTFGKLWDSIMRKCPQYYADHGDRQKINGWAYLLDLSPADISLFDSHAINEKMPSFLFDELSEAVGRFPHSHFAKW